MAYDNKLVAAKLRRWEKYLENYRLPKWEEIPDLGLYMDQVLTFLTQYLDYLPPELKDEQCVTAAVINNYVRRHIIPKPRQKKYYRTHLASLLIISSLRQSLSLTTIRLSYPSLANEEELHDFYTHYSARHQMASRHFVDQIRVLAGGILEHDNLTDEATDDTVELIAESAIIGGLSKLLAEKLILLNGKTMNDPGMEL